MRVLACIRSDRICYPLLSYKKKIQLEPANNPRATASRSLFSQCTYLDHHKYTEETWSFDIHTPCHDHRVTL